MIHQEKFQIVMIIEIKNTFFKSENLCSRYNFLELFLISEVI